MGVILFMCLLVEIWMVCIHPDAIGYFSLVFVSLLFIINIIEAL